MKCESHVRDCNYIPENDVRYFLPDTNLWKEESWKSENYSNWNVTEITYGNYFLLLFIATAHQMYLSVKVKYTEGQILLTDGCWLYASIVWNLLST